MKYQHLEYLSSFSHPVPILGGDSFFFLPAILLVQIQAVPSLGLPLVFFPRFLAVGRLFIRCSLTSWLGS